MKYLVYEFDTRDENEREWLIAILSDYHFEGFDETGSKLQGYVAAQRVRPLLVKEVLHDNDLHHITFTEREMEEKNWNEEWEKNFEPVTVADGKVGIRAPFHAPLNTPYEILIEPKMSFGTGHHATTALMIELMLKLELEGKQVLDFGSGTGVLAILAERLKAAKVVAIDNEEWAYNNCLENTAANNCVNIECFLGDTGFVFSSGFNVILANINRQVIVANVDAWAKLLLPGGSMLVSGFLQSDEAIVLAAAKQAGLEKKEIVKNNGWLAMWLVAADK